MDVISWLLESDPAVRWQALRDLTDAPARRGRGGPGPGGHQGWGARLLAARGADGQWAGGACFPADFRGDFSAGQPWTSTLPSLALLREFGIDPRRHRSVRSGRADRRELPLGVRQTRSPSSRARSSRASTAAWSRSGAYFGVPVDDLRRRACWANNSPTADGTARPRTARCARRSTRPSVCSRDCSSTSGTGGRARRSPARAAVREEYLLERRLFRRLSTGEVADRGVAEILLPAAVALRRTARARTTWRAVGGAPDERVGEALDLVRAKRSADGTWPLENTHHGAVHFALDDGDGRPSRWNTLRALRVLAWADGQPSAPDSRHVRGPRCGGRSAPRATAAPAGPPRCVGPSTPASSSKYSLSRAHRRGGARPGTDAGVHEPAHHVHAGRIAPFGHRHRHEPRFRRRGQVLVPLREVGQSRLAVRPPHATEPADRIVHQEPAIVRALQRRA